MTVLKCAPVRPKCAPEPLLKTGVGCAPPLRGRTTGHTHQEPPISSCLRGALEGAE
jgi:hypothetical protein